MATSNWNIDASHSSIVFGIRHLVIARVRGRFAAFNGELTLDEADFTRSQLSIAIDVASIDTDLAPRDAHLKSPDFFDVAAFPTATFQSRSITKSGDGYDVAGDLTLRGVTRPIVLAATFGGRATDARGRERIAFAAATTIDREAYGLKWNQALEAGGVAIGPSAAIEIDAQFLLA